MCLVIVHMLRCSWECLDEFNYVVVNASMNVHMCLGMLIDAYALGNDAYAQATVRTWGDAYI